MNLFLLPASLRVYPWIIRKSFDSKTCTLVCLLIRLPVNFKNNEP